MKQVSAAQDLKVALAAAEAASKLIQKASKTKFRVKFKGKTNLVTEVDEASQATIVRVIRKTFKHDAILAEEGDLSTTKAASRRWVVDPIDGTTNFAHGYPFYCVSIGLEEEGELKVGVVWDPNRNEVFHAIRGKGAFLNRKRIAVSNVAKLDQALLVTGFPYDLNDPVTNNVPYFTKFLHACQALRRDGSAALNLAYVASGRFDGYWELGLKPWDCAAGILLVQEAGGRVSDFKNQNPTLTQARYLSTNKKIHLEMLKLIQKIEKS